MFHGSIATTNVQSSLKKLFAVVPIVTDGTNNQFLFSGAQTVIGGDNSTMMILRRYASANQSGDNGGATINWIKRNTGPAISTNAPYPATTINNTISPVEKGILVSGNGGNSYGISNASGTKYMAYHFAMSPKLAAYGTAWTGASYPNTDVSHNLGSTPGMIWFRDVETTNGAMFWYVWHKNLPYGTYMILDSNAAAFSGSANNVPMVDGSVNGNTFTVRRDAYKNSGNDQGITTVSCISFADDTSSKGISRCGTFTTDSIGNATITLGWKPQFLLLKRIDSSSNWLMIDSYRNWSSTETRALALDNNTPETLNFGQDWVWCQPKIDGFTLNSTGANTSHGNSTWIYLAIRGAV